MRERKESRRWHHNIKWLCGKFRIDLMLFRHRNIEWLQGKFRIDLMLYGHRIIEWAYVDNLY